LQRYRCDVSSEPGDPAAVKALAHPLRLQLLDLLRFDGPATATELARRVGESSGSTSYHLRQLARHGFIEEAPGGTGRERRWRDRPRVVLLEPDGATGRELLVELLSREAHALDRFLAQREVPPDWNAASFFVAPALRLTAAELAELQAGLFALLDRFRRAEADDAPLEARPVRVLAFGYPLPLEEP
jgi:DNA-binding transcriptional ArsR family regulator